MTKALPAANGSQSQGPNRSDLHLESSRGEDSEDEEMLDTTEASQNGNDNDEVATIIEDDEDPVDLKDYQMEARFRITKGSKADPIQMTEKLVKAMMEQEEDIKINVHDQMEWTTYWPLNSPKDIKKEIKKETEVLK